MRVIETSLEEDLSLFSSYLWQHRIRHRIFEERGRQVVEVHEAGAAEVVKSAYGEWRAGNLQLTPRAPVSGDSSERLLAAGRLVARMPLLVATLAIAVLIYPFSSAAAPTALISWLTIIDLTSGATPALSMLLESWQIWRLITPIFLHFSIMHLVFNGVVMFELGRRVELVSGSLTFLLLIGSIALISNVVQFGVGGNPYFGGLSGVAYGLLGYVLVRQRLQPDHPGWQVNPGFAGSLLIFLVLFSTGVTELFGLHVANAAHWSGLLAGAVFALIGRRSG